MIRENAASQSECPHCPSGHLHLHLHLHPHLHHPHPHPHLHPHPHPHPHPHLDSLHHFLSVFLMASPSTTKGELNRILSLLQANTRDAAAFGDGDGDGDGNSLDWMWHVPSCQKMLQFIVKNITSSCVISSKQWSSFKKLQQQGQVLEPSQLKLALDDHHHHRHRHHLTPSHRGAASNTEQHKRRLL